MLIKRKFQAFLIAAVSIFSFQTVHGQNTESARLNHQAGLLKDSGRIDEAMPIFEKAIALDGNNAAAWFNLGTCYFKQKNDAKAQAYFQKAIELQPNDAIAWNQYGLCLKHLKI